MPPLGSWSVKRKCENNSPRWEDNVLKEKIVISVALLSQVPYNYNHYDTLNVEKSENADIMIMFFSRL